MSPFSHTSTYKINPSVLSSSVTLWLQTVYRKTEVQIFRRTSWITYSNHLKENRWIDFQEIVYISSVWPNFVWYCILSPSDQRHGCQAAILKNPSQAFKGLKHMHRFSVCVQFQHNSNLFGITFFPWIRKAAILKMHSSWKMHSNYLKENQCADFHDKHFHFDPTLFGIEFCGHRI